MSTPSTPEFWDRHPGTRGLLRWLVPNPNLPDPQRDVAELCYKTARAMIDAIPDGPELTAGLRKLLEAKDCFVRASLEAEGAKS
jgi:hypothetical protein